MEEAGLTALRLNPKDPIVWSYYWMLVMAIWLRDGELGENVRQYLIRQRDRHLPRGLCILLAQSRPSNVATKLRLGTHWIALLRSGRTSHWQSFGMHSTFQNGPN